MRRDGVLFSGVAGRFSSVFRQPSRPSGKGRYLSTYTAGGYVLPADSGPDFCGGSRGRPCWELHSRSTRFCPREGSTELGTVESGSGSFATEESDVLDAVAETDFSGGGCFRRDLEIACCVLG